MKSKLYIICGPTASSKSTYAMKLARRVNGAIINADSMQIYKEIPIITASPSDLDKAQIPHDLYNFLSVKEEFSVAKYLKLALNAISDAISKGFMPIVVGGTGLYINALLNGLSSIPDIDENIRNLVRAEFEEMGIEAFYNRLINLDPITKIKANDRQRVMRAYEVILQSGKPISHFQVKPDTVPLADYEVSVIMLKPERCFLYRCCDQRFTELVKNGGIEEIKKLKAANLMSKALGVAELSAYMDGRISLKEAIGLAQTKTRQYAKRQLTWFNNQVKNKEIIEFSSTEELLSVSSLRF